jgi:hypothetical protein
MFPVRYELRLISLKTSFFIVTAVRTSDVHCSVQSSAVPHV